MVRPGFDRVLVAAVLREIERGAPAIQPGVYYLHRGLGPLPLALFAVLYDRCYYIVPVLEDVRPDLQAIADLTLDGVPSAVELRFHALYFYVLVLFDHSSPGILTAHTFYISTTQSFELEVQRTRITVLSRAWQYGPIPNTT